MTKKEHAMTLRTNPDVHYNCCQSVLVPYADLCGLSEEEAMRLGEHFGSGMRHGGACGAVTGALMVLGMAGIPDAAARALMDGFKSRNGSLNCAELLKKAASEGVLRKTHCDDMVAQAVDMAEGILKQG